MTIDSDIEHIDNTTKIISVLVNVVNMDTAIANINKYLSAEKINSYICVANVHMLVTANRSEKLNQVLSEAKMVVPDGMPLVWYMRLQNYKNVSRVAGPDLLYKICNLSSKNKTRVFFYGGTVESNFFLEKNARKLFPGVNIVGCDAPPILKGEPDFDSAIVDKINNLGAQIVFVGLGCPKQELWMYKHTQHISAVLIGVGAAFDFLSGVKSRAPAWMQKAGLEWLFRLMSEPKRLWKRYLITNTLFVYYTIKDIVANKFE